MRITKRHGLFYHVFFYPLLSMLALYVSSALTKNISALTPPLLQQFATSHSAVAGTFALFVIFALFYSKHSLPLYYLSSLVVITLLIISLYQDFNKAVLFIAFSYCVLAYFLGEGWRQVLHLACYNPNMSEQYPDDSPALKIEVAITAQNGKIYQGFLVNWDEMSCFIWPLNESLGKIRGPTEIVAQYQGREFTNRGKVVSSMENKGIGVIFELSGQKKFNWQEFHSIMSEIAFVPEYLVQRG